MFCSLCKKYNKRPFNRDTWNDKPCNRIRLHSILSHENSAAHKDAVKLELAASVSVNISDALNPPVPVIGMEQAFSCLYFLAKHRIAHTTNYELLLDLMGLLGINIKDKISIAKNATYMSDKTIQEMVFIISEVIEQKILNEMNRSEHFALMFDETTDCTTTEQMAIHGRFIHANSGELMSHYLKIVDVMQPDNIETESDTATSSTISVNAETIALRVCQFMDDTKLDKEKFRGIGTDGASTMMGCHNGVVARLKAVTPSAIGVHCAAHRLNLASVQTGDSIPYIKRFNSIVRQLYDYFQNSAVRMAGLRAIQTLIHEKGKLCAPSSTRWLSMEQSVKRLKECFCSIVMSLQREGEERGDAKALGLHKLVTEYRFVCTMLLMCDVLPHISHLSKCFQITDCDYSIIPRMLSSTITSLKRLKTSNGINLSDLQEYLDTLTKANIDIKKPANLGSDYFRNSIHQPFLDKIIKNLEYRFDDKTVIAAFDILTLKKYRKLLIVMM